MAPRRCRGTRCGRHEDRSEWDRQRPGPGVEADAWSSRDPRRGAGSPRRRGSDEGFPGRDVNPNPTRVLGISVGVGSWPLGPTWLGSRWPNSAGKRHQPRFYDGPVPVGGNPMPCGEAGAAQQSEVHSRSARTGSANRRTPSPMSRYTLSRWTTASQSRNFWLKGSIPETPSRRWRLV